MPAKECGSPNKLAVIAGPRQFLYAPGRCALLSFLLHRIKTYRAKNKNEVKKRTGHSKRLVARSKVDPEIFRAARAELVWLKSVKGKPTWQKVFADFLLYRILIKFRAGANFTGAGQKYTSGKINPL